VRCGRAGIQPCTQIVRERAVGFVLVMDAASVRAGDADEGGDGGAEQLQGGAAHRRASIERLDAVLHA
jgi:hypothetical protein